MGICREKHGDSTFSCEQLRDQMAMGSETAQRILRNRHPKEFRTVAEKDIDEINATKEAKRVAKLYSSLLATAIELPDDEAEKYRRSGKEHGR